MNKFWIGCLLPFFLLAGCGKKELPRSGGRTADYWAKVLQEEPSVESRAKAATKLGPLAQIDLAAFPALMNALNDSDPSVRQAAARSLGIYAKPKAQQILPALRELQQNDVDEKVREAAAKAIEALSSTNEKA